MIAYIRVFGEPADPKDATHAPNQKNNNIFFGTQLSCFFDFVCIIGSLLFIHAVDDFERGTATDTTTRTGCIENSKLILHRQKSKSKQDNDWLSVFILVRSVLFGAFSQRHAEHDLGIFDDGERPGYTFNIIMQ